MSWLTHEQIEALGFGSVGADPRLSDKASYYNCGNIRLGDHVRIDDFCVLSAGAGGIVVGNYVHLAVYSSLIGAGKIELSDFSGVSSRVSVYSSNDDFSGARMTQPTVPDAYRGVTTAPVYFGRHVLVGSGSVVLPGVKLEEGAVVGALSLVKTDCAAFTMYGGVPAKPIGPRKRDLLEQERKFRQSP